MRVSKCGTFPEKKVEKTYRYEQLSNPDLAQEGVYQNHQRNGDRWIVVGTSMVDRTVLFFSGGHLLKSYGPQPNATFVKTDEILCMEIIKP